MESLLLFAGCAAGVIIGFAASLPAARTRARAAELAARAESGEELAHLRADNARLAATLEAERERIVEERELIERLRAELQQSFGSLSAAALERNTKQFLEVARSLMEQQQQGAKGELEKRQQAIEHMVKPLRESLAKVEVQFGEIEKNRVGTERQLMTQLASLEKTAGGLANALRAPKARGRWGEMHLRRVVEVAGMLDRCDFFEQASGTDGDGRRLQPDMVIRMAGGKSIAVDAKTPMDAYLAGLETEQPEEREAKLAEHGKRVRAHVRELRSKEYARHLDDSTVLVVLFLPTEDMFRVALEHDPALIEYAASHDVSLATPSTLIGLLHGVAQGWREAALAENAKRISDAGGELYDRICTLAENFQKLGNSLKSSVKHYNGTLGSLERRVLPKVRELRELEVPATKMLEDIAEVEEHPSEPRSAELVERSITIRSESVVETPPLTVVGSHELLADAR